MIPNEQLIKVTNRDNGSVGYVIPDLNNLYRSFEKGETKEITMGELRKLTYVPGGEKILKEFLRVEEDPEVIKELFNNNVEEEYFYTEEDVKKLLLYGSYEQLLDCLDFAPMGVIDLIKEYAVKLEINDLKKRDAILQKTGYNVSKVIEINKESEKEDTSTETAQRRTAPMKASSSEKPDTRRVTTAPNYKVVQKKDKDEVK